MKTLWLSDAKVIKYFGTRPWLGRRMRLTKPLDRGNLPYVTRFGKEVKDKHATREVTIALKRTYKPGLYRGPSGALSEYEVHVEAHYQEWAELWLVDNCR
jgi:hypothetical protein